MNYKKFDLYTLDNRIIITYRFPLYPEKEDFYQKAMDEYNRVLKIKGGSRKQIERHNLRFENSGSKNIDLSHELYLIGVSTNVLDNYIYNNRVFKYSTCKVYKAPIIFGCVDCYLIAETFDLIASVINSLDPLFLEKHRDKMKEIYLVDIKPNFNRKSVKLLRERSKKQRDLKKKIITTIEKNWRNWRTDLVTLMDNYLENHNLTKHKLAHIMGLGYRDIYFFYQKDLKLTRRFSSFLKIVEFFVNEGLLEAKFNIEEIVET